MATAPEFRRLLRRAEVHITASDINALAAKLAGPAPDGALRYSEDDKELVTRFAGSNTSHQGGNDQGVGAVAVLVRLLLPDSPPAVQLPAAASVLRAAMGWIEGWELAKMMGRATTDDMLASAVPEVATRFAEALHRCDQLLAPLAAAQLHGLTILLTYVQAERLADGTIHRGMLAAAKSIAAAATVEPEGSLRRDPLSVFGLYPNWNATTLVCILGKAAAMHASCRWAVVDTATLIARKVGELAATSDDTLRIFGSQFDEAVTVCLTAASFATLCKNDAALPALDDIQRQVLSMAVRKPTYMGPSAPSIYRFLRKMTASYGSSTPSSASASSSRRSRQRQLRRRTDWVAKAAQAAQDMAAAAAPHSSNPGAPASNCQDIAALLPCVAYLLKAYISDLEWRHHRPAMAAAVAAAEKIMDLAVGWLMGAPPDFLAAPCRDVDYGIEQIVHCDREKPADTVGERLAVAAGYASGVAYHAGFMHLMDSEACGIGQPGTHQSDDDLRAMADALVADGALSTVLLWLQLPVQHLVDFARPAASQGRCLLHSGVSRACEMIPTVMAAVTALVKSGQQPRLALLRLAFAGGATLTRVVALVLSGESALQHGGDLTPQVGPQMLSAAVRRCALQGLPPPAPPIVQQAVAALTSFLPAAAAAGEAFAALAAASALADVFVFAPSAAPLLAEGGPHAWRPVLLQVRRRAPAPVMAAIALHLELISDLVSGAIPRHLPDDFEGAAAVAAAMAALGI